jgi:hypothetical protein
LIKRAVCDGGHGVGREEAGFDVQAHARRFRVQLSSNVRFGRREPWEALHHPPWHSGSLSVSPTATVEHWSRVQLSAPAYPR